MIQTFCPYCSKEFRLPPDLAGRKLKCNSCSEKFRIPGEFASGPASKSAAITQDRPIETRCPRCLAEYSLKPKYAGESVRCKTCRNPFVVPNPHEPADDPELDDLIDVTPEIHAPKIAPVRQPEYRPATAAPRTPAPPRKPEPQIVELTEDDIVDDSPAEYDLYGDAVEMRTAARHGASRSAPSPLPRKSYVPDEPSFTPTKIRRAKRKSGSDFGDSLKTIGSGFLSVVVFLSLAYMRYERRRMRNERNRAAAQATVEPENKVISLMRKAETTKFPDLAGDGEQPKNAGLELMRQQKERMRQERESRPSFPRNSGFRPGGPPGFGPGFPN